MNVHQVDGTIVSVNVADKKGVRKQPVESITLVVDHGVEGDAHAGPWHRQVSLLANESIEKMLAACPTVNPGAFGENVTTEGLVLYELPVGTRFYAGEVLLEVTQIGKECHDRCAIFHQAGDCVMPREGIFARVIEGGQITSGNGIVLMKNSLIAAAVLTVSDKGSRGERDDSSGDALEAALREARRRRRRAGDRARRGRPDRRRAAALGRRDAGEPGPDDRRHRHDDPRRDARGHADGARPSGARFRRGHARRIARQDARTRCSRAP